MSPSEQQQWAAALKKAQTEAAGVKKRPFSAQKKYLSESIEYQKNLLREAMEADNKKKMVDLIDKLISLRARQTALFIQEKKEKGVLTDYVIQRYTRSYAHDCVKLLVLKEEARKKIV